MSTPKMVTTTRSARRAAKMAARARAQRIRLYILRTLLCTGTALALFLFLALGSAGVVFKGPSQSASDVLVISALETSAMKFVPRLFFSKDYVDEVVARNTIEDDDVETDTNLVVVADTPEITDVETPDIEVVDVNGPTFTGKMMIVKDPKRVTIGTCGKFGSSSGKTLLQITRQYEAVGGLNGGAFVDVNGQGDGGTPDGIVYSGGKLLWTKLKDEYEVKTVIGFNKDDKLVFTKVNETAAKKANFRDATSFGPVLIKNGEPAPIKGRGSGMNPRAAIGQRADGTVLLLVIDGRKVNSLGATLVDLINVMTDFGAVNAANLDGGSSAYLVYEDQYVNEGSSLTGPRGIATAFVVK